jgi:hypothetical protein
MNLMQKIIYTGFAAAAIASASMPVFSSADPAPFADDAVLVADNAESNRR